MLYRCIVCNKNFEKKERSYICENNHSFDISKEGYVNLLKKQGNKEFGDSVEMVRARHRFFSKDYYHDLKVRISEIVKEFQPSSLLDLGCGEGYYTNYLYDQMNNCDIVGLDISKEAVKIAAKSHKAEFLVGSVQDIPIQNSQADLALNCFSPIDCDEIERILKKPGIFISVQVGIHHLLQLKEFLYENVYLNEVNYLEDSRFSLINEETISFDIHIDNHEDIDALFNMTPYSHHTSLKSKERLKTLETLTTRCDFVILVYQLNKTE